MQFNKICLVSIYICVNLKRKHIAVKFTYTLSIDIGNATRHHATREREMRCGIGVRTPSAFQAATRHHRPTDRATSATRARAWPVGVSVFVQSRGDLDADADSERTRARCRNCELDARCGVLTRQRRAAARHRNGRWSCCQLKHKHTLAHARSHPHLVVVSICFALDAQGPSHTHTHTLVHRRRRVCAHTDTTVIRSGSAQRQRRSWHSRRSTEIDRPIVVISMDDDDDGHDEAALQ